jgi:tetratricopeptide (TPR) repeat protein
MSLHVSKSYNELVTEAKDAEENSDLETAAKLLERAIKVEPLEEFAYNRLMIIYRKLYQYENELRVIDKGITNFENFYKKKKDKLLKKHKAAEQLSKSLAKSLGLTDKKGNEIYHTEPIDKWMKRKVVVEKKLGK